jgi:hypothetical protein
MFYFLIPIQNAIEIATTENAQRTEIENALFF